MEIWNEAKAVFRRNGFGKEIPCATFVAQRPRNPFVFEIGESQQRLIIDACVLNHFAEHQLHDGDSLEAGGQLFARFSDHEITITDVTGPRLVDHRSRYLYLPSRREEQREIDEMHRKEFHFVGTGIPIPKLFLRRPLPISAPSRRR
jgi:hypothetical protein